MVVLLSDLSFDYIVKKNGATIAYNKHLVKNGDFLAVDDHQVRTNHYDSYFIIIV